MKLDSATDLGQTIIGKTVVIKGEVTGGEPLTVEGRVEGKIQLNNSVTVEESGFVKADIDAESITVAGAVSGNIVANDKVEILRGGFMIGDIKAPRVIINDGAHLKGQVEMEISSDRLTEKESEVERALDKRSTDERPKVSTSPAYSFGTPKSNDDDNS